MNLLLTITLCIIFGLIGVYIKGDTKNYLYGFITGTIITFVNVWT